MLPIPLLGLLFFAQDIRFGEKIEVRLIEVDAVVTDREGHRVYGLTPDDFEVYEGHTKQAITNFTEYRATPAAPAAASSSVTLQPPEPARPAAREPHSLLVLVDPLPRADLVRQETLQQVDDLLTKIVHPGDHVSLIYWEPEYQRPKPIVESSDPAAVMRAFRSFAGTMKPVTAASDQNDAGAYERVQSAARGRASPIDFKGQIDASRMLVSEERLMFLHRKTAAIRRMVDALGSQPGRKSVLYVSDQFRLEDPDPGEPMAKQYVDEITRAANANGVTFYAVHPSPVSDTTNAQNIGPVPIDAGEEMLHTAALQRLTDPTGGLLNLNRASIAELAPQIADDLESYYSIAYRAGSNGRDRVREITVKTKNSGYRVRARKSVVEKSAATIAREEVVSRLFVDEGANDVRFDVQEGALKRTSRNRWLLPITVKIPVAQLQFAEERGEKVAHAGVLIASANGVTEVTSVNEDELRIVDRNDLHGFVTYSVEILGDQRGSKVSIGVVDRRTGAIGVRTIDNRNRFR